MAKKLFTLLYASVLAFTVSMLVPDFRSGEDGKAG